jgi:hypothetical protein
MQRLSSCHVNTLASSAKSRRSHSPRKAVPVLKQVRPASIEQRAEVEAVPDLLRQDTEV